MTARGMTARGMFAAFAAAYVVMALLGRTTVAERAPTSLVWPAAGLAVLWLLTQSTAEGTVACLAALAVLQTAVMLVTDAAVLFALLTALAVLVEVAVTVWLVRRWCPTLLGAGGSASVHDPAVLARAVAAAVVGTACSALVGGVGVALDTGAWHLTPFIGWLARHLAGLLVVGVLGHLVWEHRREPSELVPQHRRQELFLLVSLLVLVVVVCFAGELPLTFLLVGLTVWTALRFPTLVSVVFTVLSGAGVVVLAKAGREPFGHTASAVTEGLLTQGFLLTMLLTVLVIGTIRDELTSAIARLSASEEALTARGALLDSMTEAMSEGLAVVDVHGRVVRINGAARRLGACSGPDGEERLSAITRPDGTEYAAGDFPSERAMAEQAAVEEDVALTLEDGTRRILAVTAAPIPGEGAVVVYRDVTEERRQSTVLAEFATTAAHDLRSPMTAVRGWLDLAAARIDEPDDVLRSIDRARGGVDRMQSLITDLLSQAVAEGGGLRPEPVELGGADGLVAEIALDLDEDAEISAATDLPVVAADPDLVRQLFRNLLGNALKYVAEDQAARVVVTGRPSGERAVLEVTDNGIGIPDDARNLVFERFHRAHADDTRFSGTGLGLSICRTIVERHGGRIEALAAPDGHGTTFRFDLPLAAPPRGTPGAAGS